MEPRSIRTRRSYRLSAALPVSPTINHPGLSQLHLQSARSIKSRLANFISLSSSSLSKCTFRLGDTTKQRYRIIDYRFYLTEIHNGISSMRILSKLKVLCVAPQLAKLESREMENIRIYELHLKKATYTIFHSLYRVCLPRVSIGSNVMAMKAARISPPEA